jgi:HSP20 family protein
MDIVPWDPWEEFERLQAEMSKRWDDFLSKLRRSRSEREQIAFLPEADIVETQRDVRLYLSIPGLIEEDIDVSVGINAVTVRGERQCPYDAGMYQTSTTELRYGFFERRFRLPTGVDSTTLKATYDAGVLTIIVAKSRRR